MNGSQKLIHLSNKYVNKYITKTFILIFPYLLIYKSTCFLIIVLCETINAVFNVFWCPT